MADQRVINSTAPAGNQTSTPGCSSRNNPKPFIPPKITVRRAADLAFPATNLGSSAALPASDSAQQEDSFSRHGPTATTRGVKRRAMSPPLSSPSLPPPSSPISLLPVSPVSSLSSPPSSPPPREPSQHALARIRSRSTGSKSAPIEILSSESELEPEPEPEPDPPTAQTRPSSSKTERRRSALTGQLGPTRPNSKRRAVSAPTPLPGDGAKRPQDIDGDIEDQIWKPRKLSKEHKKLGYVYVVPAMHNGKRIIKIGHTTEASVNTRIDGIKCKCKKIQFLPPSESSPEHRQVHLYYEEVEGLAHKELANFRYSFDCCGTKHKEYFALDEEIGHLVVERWARFCARQPFAEHFTLKEEWKFHLDRFRERSHGRGSDEEKKDDHIKRGQRWETFLGSKRSDWYRYRAVTLWKRAWAHRWQLWSLVLAVWLGVCERSRWTSIFLLMTVGGIYGEDSARDLAVDLIGLLRDVAVDLGEWLLISESVGVTTTEDEQAQGAADDEEGVVPIPIWEDSEKNADGRENREEQDSSGDQEEGGEEDGEGEQILP